jgi:hypothetical protein
LNWARLTTTKAALVLVVFGLIAIAVYFLWPGTADWAPNIATEAFSIAVTILVVDQIVQRERRRRVQPRLDRALDVLHHAFRNFVWRTQWDYITTHLGVDLSKVTLPSDFVAICEFWVQGLDTIDNPRPTSNGRSLFLDEGIEFVRRVQRVADSDRDLLESELVIAIDRLDPIFSGHSLADLAAEVTERGVRGLDDWALIVLVQSTAQFGEALRGSAGDRSFDLWTTSSPEGASA